MRKFKFILLAAISLFGLLMGGCTKDNSGISYEGDAQIELELSTFAVNGGSDTNAKEAEKVIKSAYVFIFNAAGVLENPGKTAVTTLNGNGEVVDAAKKLNAKWSVYAGNKDIYVITNPDTELAGRLVAMSATNGLEKSALEALITDEAAFTADVASFATKGMLMTGKVSAAAVSGSSTTVPVTVTRRHARIDFMLRKAKDLEGATVVVKNVQYKDQIRKTIVFSSTPTAATAAAETKSPNTTIDAQQATAGEWSGDATDYTAVTDFYSFEKAVGTKAVCLEMTVSINGTDKLLPVYICSTAIGTNKTGNDEDKPVAIEANTVYKVLGTLTRQSVDIALDILDWNDKNVNGDIYGADFTVSKSKVLVPIVNGEGRSETVDLSASENIKFIEYEYDGNKGNSSILPSGLTVTGAEAFNGSSTTGSVTFASGTSGDAVAPVYLWFKAGNIKKRIEVNSMKYFFSVQAPSAYYAYSGGTQQYRVTSYKQLGGDIGIGWTAKEYSIDNGATWTTTHPAWITEFTDTWADGGTNVKNSNATLAKSVGENPHNDVLKAASSVSNYDLSTKGGSASRNTANCYVVNAPGTYSLPLVYGNAIKDGAVNTPAFAPGGTGRKLGTFFSATGTIPTDGMIAGATAAKLIWQDAENLVTLDATTAISGTYPNQILTFTVPAANICQGNAVIAVTDGTNVLWSWHIWVTDYKLGSDDRKFINATPKEYTFMPYNIGWCDGLTYPARSIKVRFTQNETGIQKEMDINQLVGQEMGNSPYFQFGRKDPFVAGMLNSSNSVINKTWYDGSGVEKINTAPTGANWTAGNNTTAATNVIKNGILNPDKFCLNTYMDYYYYNLWSANNTVTSANDDAVTKTVYDPSPAGYHLPASNAFTGFTSDGQNQSTAANINGTWDATSKSWTFSKDGYTVNFPAVGYRYNSSSAVYLVGLNGYYWSAVPNLQNYGRNLAFSSGNVNPLSNGLRAYGFSVRCVQE